MPEPTLLPTLPTLLSTLPIPFILCTLLVLFLSSSIAGCSVHHLTIPDLVVGVGYHQAVGARSEVSGTVALRMTTRAEEDAAPRGARRRRRAVPFPCASAALCRWETESARRVTQRLLGAKQ